MSRLNELFLADLDARLKPHPFRGYYKTAWMWFIGLFLVGMLTHVFWRTSGMAGGIMGLALIVAIGLPLRYIADYRRVRSIGREGAPVSAVLVQANTRMFRKNFDYLPCQALISFEGGVNGNVPYLQALAGKMFSLKNTRPAEPDLQQVAQMVTNELAVFYRRQLLPVSFTGGPRVYAADLWIDSKFLREKRLTPEDRVFLCLATPGDKGKLELVPWQVAERYRNEQQGADGNGNVQVMPG